MTKQLSPRSRAARGPARKRRAIDKGSSELDGHPLLAEATAFLRNPASGRLDVKRVAAFYREPLRRFANALRISPSAVSQTPDSKRHQVFLLNFERVARIAPLLKNKTSFSIWAKTPNAELKGASPVDFLWGSPTKVRALVDAVEDVIVGQPD
jgi:hypothetical protein